MIHPSMPSGTHDDSDVLEKEKYRSLTAITQIVFEKPKHTNHNFTDKDRRKERKNDMIMDSRGE